MERELLRQYASIKMEIIDIERRIGQDEKDLRNMDGEVIKVKGGSGGKRLFTVNGYGKEYSNRKTMLQAKKLRREELKSKLENIRDDIELYVSEIDDSETRRIISLRYIDNMTWQDVAKAMGDGWNADTCRIRHQRFMEKEEKKHEKQ
jgi:hypothetical protein